MGLHLYFVKHQSAGTAEVKCVGYTDEWSTTQKSRKSKRFLVYQIKMWVKGT